MNEYYVVGIFVTTVLTAALAILLGGNIRKTDADKLWEESKAIRDALRKDKEELEERLIEFQTSSAKRWRLAVPILQQCATEVPELRGKIEELIWTLDLEEWKEVYGLKPAPRE